MTASAAATWLRDEAPRLAEQITEAQFRAQPELAARFGPVGRAKCTQDVRYHLDYLGQAVARQLPALFVDYIGWARVLLARLGLSADDLQRNLESIDGVLAARAPVELRDLVRAPMRIALEALPGLPDDLDTMLDPGGRLAGLARRYLDALLDGRRDDAVRLVVDAAADGTDVRELYLGVFQPCLREVGRLWQTNRVTVAHEHYFTAATQLAIAQLYPRVMGVPRIGRSMVATCIQGDLHEVGIRMVADFFEMNGWDTYYLGANTPVVGVLSTIRERRPQLVAVSATITRHLDDVAQLIAKIRAEPDGASVTILVGGYPFNVAPELAAHVGADGQAAQADEAVRRAGQLLSGR